jgi:hypothetical protein
MVALAMPPASHMICSRGGVEAIPGPKTELGGARSPLRPGTFTGVKLREVPDTVGRRVGWKIVSTACGLLGALVARRLVRTAWAAVTGESEEGPILDPADRRFKWRDAVLWAATVSVGLGIAKVVSARIAVAGWEVATGTLPPGVEEPAEV